MITFYQRTVLHLIVCTYTQLNVLARRQLFIEKITKRESVTFGFKCAKMRDFAAFLIRETVKIRKCLLNKNC